MKSIKALVKNPANALEFMCRGLERQSKRDDFEIRMDTYGGWKTWDNVTTCYGCAATCAIQEITGKNLTKENICETSRYEALGFDIVELSNFEMAIDDARKGFNFKPSIEEARKGHMADLFRFFNKTPPAVLTSSLKVNDNFQLNSYNFLREIPKVREYIAILREENPNWCRIEELPVSKGE